MKDLASAFDLSLPEMVVLVGAGGKTSLMFALAEDMVRHGARVVTTTTTKILVPGPEQSRAVILSSDYSVLLAETRSALKNRPHVTMASARSGEGKLAGVIPELVDDLFTDADADLVLVEADGARGFPLKAPGQNEPVIPSLASIVVPVAGLGGLGRPLGKDTVFRPEVYARLSGLALGRPVTPESIARVMFDPGGLCREAPERARIIPFLNQADLVDMETARASAEIIFETGPETVNRVVWGSLKKQEGGFEIWPEG